MKILKFMLDGAVLAAFFFALMWLAPLAWVAMGGDPR